MKRLTTEDFIAKAIKKHGDRYDYSNTVYVNAKTKVVIKCKEHGSFEQTPDGHGNKGKGCPACSGNKRLTTASFIQKARKVHGNRYDYSKVKYTSSKEYVTIVCYTHGTFDQRAYSHLAGRGCTKCSVDASRSTTEEFIEKSKLVHGNLYDYTDTKYIRIAEKVAISCKEHGKFLQNPNSHLAGAGCPTCVKKVRRNTESFIEAAKSIHEDFYDYSKTIFVTTKQKINIICPTHGEFSQAAGNHLRGQGCPDCCRVRNRHGDSIVYLLEVKHPDFSQTLYKIGVSERVNERVSILNRNTLDIQYKLLGVISSHTTHTEALKAEKSLHSKFKNNKAIFNTSFDGYTEIFAITKDDAFKLLGENELDF